MRQIPRRRSGPVDRGRSGPTLYDHDLEGGVVDDLERDFWGRTTVWTKRHHDLPETGVDHDADTVPTGIGRPLILEDDSRTASTFAGRLGFGSIDPLITRTALILVAALIAVPVAWMNRDENAAAAATDSVVTVTSAALTGTNESLTESTSAVVGETQPVNVVSDDTRVVTLAPVDSVSATKATVDAAQSRGAGTKITVSTPPTTAAVPPCGSTYVVRAGDSWSLVADRASIRMSELLATNGASTRSMLYPDDEICLPPGAVVVIPTTVPRVTSAPQTTHAPTTTTTIVLPPEPTSANAEAIIREVWPDDLEERALEIARRESRLHANVSNWCCVGLFQIHWNAHKRWLAGIGVTEKVQLFDARTNARAALALYERNGWTPWNL